MLSKSIERFHKRLTAKETGLVSDLLDCCFSFNYGLPVVFIEFNNFYNKHLKIM